MLSKIFKVSTVFAFVFVFALTSCEKETLEITTTENFIQQDEEGRRGFSGQRGGRCFIPVFPITLNFPDGSTVEVADKEAAQAAKAAFREANPENEERPTIAMPFDVQLRDSSIVTITSEEDLATLRETCGERRGNRGQRGNRGRGGRFGNN